MKLWSVIFTDEACPIVSARVACDDKERVLRDISEDLPPQPIGSVLCRLMGKIDSNKEGIIHMVRRDGEIYEASIS